ncbi:MAG: hypothetical protein CAF45_000730 [Nitrospira sp. CG24E]|nr:MAG: hypothetical protein CAF45_000730 [Nitrospira sp. CG24E]
MNPLVPMRTKSKGKSVARTRTPGLGNRYMNTLRFGWQCRTCGIFPLNKNPALEGTVSVQGVAYQPANSDGPSAGAAMAVGFIAMFKGDHIQRGIALTGTFEPNGQIGPVGGIPDKIRAAAREGYRTVLVPRGQIHDAQWNLIELGFQLNVTVKEVDSIDEAYQLMTGQKI